MRIIVSGGGTGGHIYPAVTLINAIKKIDCSAEFLYVGTKSGLEADIVPKEGLPFATIDVNGFSRSLTLRNIKTALRAGRSVVSSYDIIKNFRPNAVVGTGGYVCGPVLLAASLMSVPTLIQEQNVVPGVTNKILAQFVDKIAVGYFEAMSHFKAGKAAFTGNPIRDIPPNSGRREALASFDLDPAKLTVLISGGSRGARSINRAMIDVHRYFYGKPDIQLLHVTGVNEYDDVVAKLLAAGIREEKTGNIKIRPYLYDMPKALRAADIAVFRAGAVGLAELTALGLPAILVPYPYASANHQEHNARSLVSHGAAYMILDRELTATRLIDYIMELKDSPQKRTIMSKASRSMGRPNAAADIAKMVLSIAKP